MIVKCKNTDGVGNVTYVEYEIPDVPEDDEDATAEDYEAALAELGVK